MVENEQKHPTEGAVPEADRRASTLWIGVFYAAVAFVVLYWVYLHDLTSDLGSL